MRLPVRAYIFALLFFALKSGKNKEYSYISIVKLEANGLGRTIYRSITVTQNKIIDDVNAFANELEAEMLVSAWKRLYFKKDNIKNFDIAPEVLLDRLVYCESCDIDATVKDVTTEIENKVRKYIDSLRKEIALYILCSSQFTKQQNNCDN